MADAAVPLPGALGGQTAGGRRRRFDLKRQPGFGAAALLCLLLLYAPIAVLVGFSFNTSRSVTRWAEFSLDWYATLLRNDAIHDAAINSLTVGAVATILSTILATAAALATTRTRPWRGQTVSYLVIINGGRTPGGVPSTLVDCTTPELQILREGRFHFEALFSALNDES